MSGVDYLTPLSAVGAKNLEGGVGALYRVNISPSSFKKTRLELVSNCYQFYRFTSLSISYAPTLPDTTNGSVISYFDTDPNDLLDEYASAEDVFKIAQAHKLSKTTKLNKAFSVQMPISDDRKWFYIVEQKELRFSTQASFYILQMGACVDFEGKEVQENFNAGNLKVSWTIEFKNEQLNQLDRIVDGTSQQQIIRVFKTLKGYRRIDFGNITVANNYLAGTNYRSTFSTISPTLFGGGVGSYIVQIIPIAVTIPNTVKRLVAYSPDYYASDPFSSLGTLFTQSKINAAGVTSFIENITKTFIGGIELATKLFDVIEIVLPLFVDGQVTGTQVDVSYAADNASSYLPIGYSLITYDGKTPPILDLTFEFKDQAHASDTSVTIAYQAVCLFYPLLGNTDQILKKLPGAKIPIRKSV